ncbi:MAG: carboxymuconolactone decarboxylase family protein [Oscillospiraceae bacterium]
MKKAVKSTMNTGSRLYTACESYRILYLAARSVSTLKRAMQLNVLSPSMKERIMLCVTQVNGCAMCSYAHTQAALEAGLGESEIRQLLGGYMEDADAEELPALLFAQHYANSRGTPSQKAWQQVVSVYGNEKAKAILAAIRVIMAGNTLGIPIGSLKGRFSGNTDLRSSLGYELKMLACAVLFVPAVCIHALVSALLRHNFMDNLLN